MKDSISDDIINIMSYFLTVEGGEFTGKTSVVIPALTDVFRHAGFDVLSSREPGGTPEAEKIRNRIFQRLEEEAPAIELAKLFNEARKLHLDQVVNPFLSDHANGIVLSDRYADTTMVLQGKDGGVSIDELLRLHGEYTNNQFPDHTLILYFPEDHFDSTFRLRKKYAKKKAAQEGRDNTKWDERPLAHQRDFQRFYLGLPLLYEEKGIYREFTGINAAQHPYDVIRDSVEANQAFFIRKGVEANLIDSFSTLVEEPRWKRLDEIWNEQRKMAKEGVRGKDIEK